MTKQEKKKRRELTNIYIICDDNVFSFHTNKPKKEKKNKKSRNKNSNGIHEIWMSIAHLSVKYSSHIQNILDSTFLNHLQVLIEFCIFA